MSVSNSIQERRSAERYIINMTASCEKNGRIYPCEIIDLSVLGVGLRVNINIATGETVNIISGDFTLPARIVRSGSDKTGLMFKPLTAGQTNYIKWLCRKNVKAAPFSLEKEYISEGKKIYILKAETENDIGLLGIFLTAVRKNCKGYIKDFAIKRNIYQVEVSDSEMSVSSFESLITLWKADKLISAS